MPYCPNCFAKQEIDDYFLNGFRFQLFPLRPVCWECYYCGLEMSFTPLSLSMFWFVIFPIYLMGGIHILDSYLRENAILILIFILGIIPVGIIAAKFFKVEAC